MAAMSIGKAWEETVAFVAREAALLLPVALLFVALPAVVLQEMTPPELTAWSAAPKPGTMPPVPASYFIAMLLTFLLVWFGSLTLFALALRPGISVGEALRLALHRLPVLLATTFLAGALVFLAVVLVSIPLTLLLGIAGPIVAIVIVGLFVGARLALLNPVVIDDQLGVIASLRHAWALTKGQFWRIFGFLLVVMIFSMIVVSAAQSVVGLAGQLLGGAEGARLAGGIAAAAVSGVIQVYMLVMLARLYRQTAAR